MRTLPTFLFLLLFLPLTYGVQAQTAVPTPTRDRLAAPPTVPAPTQADEGAQLYWLNCQPCHGDIGQGLTDAPDDDWRSQYPEDHQNCWESGCHGSRPYADGFTLPRQVPAIIGPNTLTRFTSMAEAHTFMHNSMPMHAPASLPAEQYLAITAYLAREHGLIDKPTAVLTTDQLHTLLLNPAQATQLAAPPAATHTPTPAIQNQTAPATHTNWWIGGGLLLLMLLLMLAAWQRHGRGANTPN